MVSTAPGHGVRDPSQGVLGSGGCPGTLEGQGRTVHPSFPRKRAQLLLAQLPPPKGLALGFLSRLQISLHRSACVSRVSPSLEVFVFSDFCQLLMVCETAASLLGRLCIPVLNVSKGQSESLLSTEYDGVEMTRVDGHISILLPWDFQSHPSILT